MMTWIINNSATIIICLALIAVVTLIIVNMRKDKKKGKSSCGGSCGSCPMAGKCHSGATIPQKICK